MWESLHIQGFKAFSDLTIEKLGRVNLITGRNNVGKTCLLEALRLLAEPGTIAAVCDLLSDREEIGPVDGYVLSAPIRECVVSSLFHGRADTWVPGTEFVLEATGDAVERLRVSKDFDTDVRPRALGRRVDPGHSWPVLRVRRGSDPEGYVYPIESLADRSMHDRAAAEANLPGGLTCQYVPGNGLPDARIEALWDSVSLTDPGDEVLTGLRAIEPRLEGVAMVELSGRRERSAVAKLARVADDPLAEPAWVPLRSLGEGMSRVFGIALSLACSAKGVLLLDEVENGLHYSVQEDLWRFVFEASARLNVQVFAATHSFDCIEAFQAAAAQHPEDGALIRLHTRTGEVGAFVFDEDDLEVVTRGRIEVR